MVGVTGRVNTGLEMLYVVMVVVLSFTWGRVTVVYGVLRRRGMTAEVWRGSVVTAVDGDGGSDYNTLKVTY